MAIRPPERKTVAFYEPVQVTDPITGEHLREVPHATPADVAQAAQRARAAQAAWAMLPFRKRAKIIIRFHDMLLDRRDEMMAVIRSETGKSPRDAFAELFGVVGEARYYAYHGAKALKPRRAKSAIPLRERVRVVRKPRGVVGIISPWNFPLILSVGDAIPALLAGNAVILKPSELTPLTAMLARDIMHEAGLPADLFQIVNGYGNVLAEPLVEASDFIMFTGSERVGRIIGELCGRTLTPFTLELGGKNAMIVLEDANIQHAAIGAVEGSFNNAGQVCINWERILVHEAVYDAFVAAFIRETERIRLGGDENADFGSLISANQFERVQQHVADAVKKGAQVISGGQARPDFGPLFYEPTILSGVTPDMALYTEETFGPVTAVTPIATAEEAIQIANNTDYGLHFGIFSRSRSRAERLAQALDVGTVSINDTYTMWAAVDAPMGGVKASGVGRRHGPEGIQQYTHTQTLFTNRTHFQVGDGQTAMSLGKPLMNLLTWSLKLWRRIPFLR